MDFEQFVLLCGTVIFILCIVAPTIIVYKAIVEAGPLEPGIVGRLGGEGNAVRMLAIFVIIVTVFYLALSGHLDQTITTFLSAVAGFAFGGFEKRKGQSSEKRQKSDGKKGAATAPAAT